MPEKDVRSEPRVEAPPAAPAKPPGLFSTAGMFVVMVIVLVEGVLVHLVTKFMSSGEESISGLTTDYEQVELGAVERKLEADDGGILTDRFAAEIVLVLNPVYGDLPKLKANVEKRKAVLQDILNTEIIHRKNPEEFRKPNFLENLKREIKQRLNQELGFAGGGQEVISAVLIPKVIARPGSR